MAAALPILSDSKKGNKDAVKAIAAKFSGFGDIVIHSSKQKNQPKRKIRQARREYEENPSLAPIAQTKSNVGFAKDYVKKAFDTYVSVVLYIKNSVKELVEAFNNLLALEKGPNQKINTISNSNNLDNTTEITSEIETAREKEIKEDEQADREEDQIAILKDIHAILQKIHKNGGMGGEGSTSGLIKGAVAATTTAALATGKVSGMLKTLPLISKIPGVVKATEKTERLVSGAAAVTPSLMKGTSAAVKAYKSGSSVAKSAGVGVGATAKGIKTAVRATRVAQAAKTAEVAAKATQGTLKATETGVKATEAGAKIGQTGLKTAETAGKVGKLAKIAKFLGPLAVAADVLMGTKHIFDFVELKELHESGEVSDEQFKTEGKALFGEIARDLGYPAIGAIIGGIAGGGIGALPGAIAGSTVGALDFGLEWLTGWSPAKALGGLLFDLAFSPNKNDVSKDANEIMKEVAKNNAEIEKRQAEENQGSVSAQISQKQPNIAAITSPTNPSGVAANSIGLTPSQSSVETPSLKASLQPAPSAMSSASGNISNTNTPQIFPAPQTNTGSTIESETITSVNNNLMDAQSATSPTTIINNYYNNSKMSIAGGGGGTTVITDGNAIPPDDSGMHALLTRDLGRSAALGTHG